MHTLICSQFGEVQVEHVCKIIKSRGGSPVVFERYRNDHLVTYSYFGSTTKATIQIGKKKYPLRKDVFPSVWYRIKPFIPSEMPGGKFDINERFCVYEWKQALNVLDIFLQDSKWINKIDDSQKVSRKAYQLKLATDCHLTIPFTYITNNAFEVLDLFNKGDVIYKTLSSFFTENETIYTNQVMKEDIINNKESISMAPGIFQNLIKKEYELRVTVIGNKVFPIRINSQKRRDTKIDWRKNPIADMYEVGKLSKDTTRKLLSFHKKAGLVYAAYDFIVDINGNEIFLECNPSGQWLWLEQDVNMNISESLVSELLVE